MERTQVQGSPGVHRTFECVFPADVSVWERLELGGSSSTGDSLSDPLFLLWENGMIIFHRALVKIQSY